MSRPQGITFGPDGAIWFANEEGHSIGRITRTGVISRFTSESIRTPYAITSGADGALWFVNGGNSIGRITMDGTITLFTDSIALVV